jgi:hypothetical protein
MSWHAANFERTTPFRSRSYYTSERAYRIKEACIASGRRMSVDVRSTERDHESRQTCDLQQSFESELEMNRQDRVFVFHWPNLTMYCIKSSWLMAGNVTGPVLRCFFFKKKNFACRENSQLWKLISSSYFQIQTSRGMVSSQNLQSTLTERTSFGGCRLSMVSPATTCDLGSDFNATQKLLPSAWAWFGNLVTLRISKW